MPDDLVARLASVCQQVDADDEHRVEAGRDWWPLTIGWALAGEIPALPAAVARPGSTAEVAAVLACCREARVPVTAAAGRSGVCGGERAGLRRRRARPDRAGRAHRRRRRLAAGRRPARARSATCSKTELRAEHGLTLGHWPQSIALSTVGGWLACRSAGQYSTRYGKIEDMVVGLEVVLADGRVIRTGGKAPRSAAGPDLTQLFVGSEGTLGVITEARLRAHPVPPAERRAAYGFDSFAAGLDACRRILRRGATPAVLRLYDAVESARSFDVADRHVLIVLDEGEPALVDGVMAIVAEECGGPAGAAPTRSAWMTGLVGRWLEHRNDVSALESVVRHGITVDTIEVAARWSALPAIYEGALGALQAIDGTLAASAHQSHAYPDGACLYFTFAGRPASDGAAGSVANAADAYYRRAWDAVIAATMATAAPSATTTASASTGAAIWPGRSAPPSTCWRRSRRPSTPNGILNPGKLGLPSPFGRRPPWP